MGTVKNANMYVRRNTRGQERRHKAVISGLAPFPTSHLFHPHKKFDE